MEQAIILGKALLSDKEKEKIPPYFQNQFTFNLGVIIFN
jgi:hypothetical protein